MCNNNVCIFRVQKRLNMTEVAENQVPVDQRAPDTSSAQTQNQNTG